jgi:two-component system cell cycle sensor histidine kinase/response regulator CckA
VNAGQTTVLVADDEEPVRRFVRIVLEREGFRVLEAVDGAQALIVHDSAEPPVDLLLTDVVMPLMDGGALARRLLETRPGLRVIFMSGFVGAKPLPSRATGTPAPFLQKPFDLGDLVDLVKAETKR